MSPTGSLLSAFGAGDQISGVYACTRKDLLTSKAGPYLAIELRDRSATVPGAVFENVTQSATKFEAGDFVKINGSVDKFRDSLTVRVRQIESVDAASVQLERYLPVTYRDLNELDGFFEGLAAEVSAGHYADLLQLIVNDEALRQAFRTAPCSIAGHHAYLGGLLEHTVAVAAMANETVVHHPGLNRDLLLTAALLHDIGRGREFEYGATFTRTQTAELLGHVQLGLRILAGPAKQAGLDEVEWGHLAHCILSHHGSDRVGGKFQSAEAATLFQLNRLDSAVKDAVMEGKGLG